MTALTFSYNGSATREVLNEEHVRILMIDSEERRYIVVFNKEKKVEWARVYTGKGRGTRIVKAKRVIAAIEATLENQLPNIIG